MANFINLLQERKLLWGEKVSRATATLPQTTNSPIFTIAGGRIFLQALIGEVTTVIQNQANNTKLIATPTTGTASDMCAVTSTANKEVGSLLTISGNPTDALIIQSSGFVRGFAYWGVIVDIGTINLSCAASNTGSVKWDVFWLPFDDAGLLTAA